MSQRPSRRATPEHNLRENWFHSGVGREEAVERLRTAGFSEGLFLVRNSSCAGDFALSVVHNNQVIHYQIQRRGEDALFSLAENEKVIHGLDELINYYQNHSRNGLQHELKDYVAGALAPPDTRLHGTENLLHRASCEGNVTVVRELLVSGYRNLEAKNHIGETAVHLACKNGHQAVLEILLKYKARVNVSDSEGNSPLHLACQNDRSLIVRILLSKGKANPTLRNELTQRVPLHDAAQKDHLECVTALLEFHSPARPRTGRNETPSDLARSAGHHEVATFIDSFPLPFPDTVISEWYHPTIDRARALELIKEEGLTDGTFLVRNSLKKKRFFVLSLVWSGRAHHFEIEKQGTYYSIEEGPYMTSLEHLVQHYMRFSDGLPCQLRHSVPPRDLSLISSKAAMENSLTGDRTAYIKSGSLPRVPARTGPPPLPSIPVKSELAAWNGSLIWDNLGFSHSTLYNPELDTTDEETLDSKSGDINGNPAVPPRVPERTRPTAYPTNLRRVDDKKLYANNDTLRRVRHSKDNIPRESIKLIQTIGEGEFGHVFKGSYMTEQGAVKEVAIKALSDEALGRNQSEEFLREARVMMSLDHQCIVQMIGISHGPPMLMILELVPLGSLLEYLHSWPNSVSPDMEIPLWASQIACGMQYLQSKKYVHRDLAARNILLASKYQAKISDFGLSRVVGDKDYYKSETGGRWPIKWYAMECITYGTFSHASDVWSYGVVLWEMYSLGKHPYENKSGAETIEYLEAGHRLPKPDLASNNVYDFMLNCWDAEPQRRPGFQDLFRFFSDNPEYMNLTELLLTQDLQQLGM